ncbi:MAG TPA: hypothetical protein VGC11_10765 [Acidimicrobiia bacterium]
MWSRAGRFVKLAVVVAVVLAVTESALRIPAVAAAIPESGLYYASAVQARIDRIRALAADGTSVDALFVGNSVVATNISPAIVDGDLAEAGLSVTSFDLGLPPGLTIDPLRVQLDRLWLRETQPRVVVFAVRYVDFVDPVAAADSAIFTSGRIESRWVDTSLRSRIELLLIDNSALLRRAGALAGFLTNHDEEGGAGGGDGGGFPVDPRGHQPRYGTVDENVATYGIADTPGGSIASDGYDMPIDPASYESGLAMLRETHALVEARGARFVLLNMPEHPQKFLAGQDGAERYASYLDALSSFADTEGIVLLDPSQGSLESWSDAGLFFDFHHLNAGGAEVMSHAIAELLLAAGVFDAGEGS